MPLKPLARISTAIAMAWVLTTASFSSAQGISALWNHYSGDRHHAGYVDGPGDLARFSSPQALDVDAAGNIYVADRGNSVIRKITPQGVVSTIAGKAGEGGLTDGPADVARFSNLIALAVAHDGSIYLIDNLWLRRISPNGVVSTIGGTTSGGQSLISLGDSAPARSTFMFSSTGVAVDQDLNVFVSANGNILKVTPDGIATVWVNNSSPGVEHNPTLVNDLQVGADGYLYFGIPFSGVVYRISPTGEGEQIGPPQYSLPIFQTNFQGIAVHDNGEVWLSQMTSRIISTVTDDHNLQIVNEPDPRLGYPGLFLRANDIAPAPNGGVYLADPLTHSIQHLTKDGTSTVIAGLGIQPVADGPREDAGFFEASSLSAIYNDTLYVSDLARIRAIDLRTGDVATVLDRADTPYPDAFFNRIDADQAGNLYFCNFPENCISKLTTDGQWSIWAGSPDEAAIRDGTAAEARFRGPSHFAVSPAGTGYVIDYNGGYVVRAIAPDGSVSSLAGSHTEGGGYSDGTGSDARFVLPRSLGVAPDGSIWVGDHLWIRRVATDGTVTTIAGGNTYYPPPDGIGAEAGFNSVQDIAFLPNGVAIVSEFNPHRLREVRPDGTVTSLDITGTFAPAPYGTAIASLAISPTGEIYGADPYNHRIMVGFATPDAGRLANLSVLKRVGDGGSTLTAGFVAEGDAAKPVLVRAVGPQLAAHGVTSGFMPDPLLELYDRNGQLVETADNWSDADNLAGTAQRLGAFPLTAGSTDAATTRAIPGGPLTATISAADGVAGQVLVEVYDADLDGVSRLTNVSTLTTVSPGDGRLVAGFVITGTGQKTVLIRGVGPSLTGVGVPGGAVLDDPRLRLFRGSTLINQNDDWAGAPLIEAAGTAVGAFPLLGSDTTDAALLVQLEAGNYSVHLESARGDAGLAIIEVYEVK
ncbi:hypothetical protein [Actomonas aquatica]|uniref:SMP-30/Gluconolactonase/LRE-like region domain-containing protein n=1 Tax=Actomonas aquatica TaxID=2866162 RepID=A0ABZ1CDI4_9BACT|nr:hypothetical protein [Opitutus sp. WL0086]WRQ89742.1 hypothetical protein K1X11_010010 [Opitutus sp. WL0086]